MEITVAAIIGTEHELAKDSNTPEAKAQGSSAL